MKALVIGGAGFVGTHLLRYLARQGFALAATKLPGEQLACDQARSYDLDIQDAQAVAALLREVEADYVFHLAAMASTSFSWQHPDVTMQINVLGTLHVLDGLRGLPKAPRLLLVGSGEEYGSVHPDQVPITEETLLRPGNVYAISKATQTMLGTLYAKAYGLEVVCSRAFNHIGPGQSLSFVVPDFCQQIACIERGEQEPVLRVGNLEARRDFTDVRDVVRAYVLLLERGRAGEIYNVGSGGAISISRLLELLLAHTRADIRIEVDPGKFRPVDVPLIVADIKKLQNDTGWSPEIPLEESLRDSMEAARNAF